MPLVSDSGSTVRLVVERVGKVVSTRTHALVVEIFCFRQRVRRVELQPPRQTLVQGDDEGVVLQSIAVADPGRCPKLTAHRHSKLLTQRRRRHGDVECGIDVNVSRKDSLETQGMDPVHAEHEPLAQLPLKATGPVLNVWGSQVVGECA